MIPGKRIPFLLFIGKMPEKGPLRSKKPQNLGWLEWIFKIINFTRRSHMIYWRWHWQGILVAGCLDHLNCHMADPYPIENPLLKRKKPLLTSEHVQAFWIWSSFSWYFWGGKCQITVKQKSAQNTYCRAVCTGDIFHFLLSVLIFPRFVKYGASPAVPVLSFPEWIWNFWDSPTDAFWSLCAWFVAIPLRNERDGRFAYRNDEGVGCWAVYIFSS